MNDKSDKNTLDQPSLAARIQRQLRQQMHFDGVVAEGRDGAIYLSGRVPSRRDRVQAEMLARQMAGGAPVENDLAVERVLPEDRSADAVDDLVQGQEAESVTGTIDEAGDINPEFTGQPLETNALNAIDSGAYDADPNAEPDPTYFAPTDPVITAGDDGNLEVLGGFDATSMSSDDVDQSVEDNRPGDEALIAAIQRELREDAATTALSIDVVVENGIAHLRGRVPDLEDAENAEEVAGRVPGVREVIDELDVQAM
jgi:osmotically-inducible protein OsmY